MKIFPSIPPTQLFNLEHLLKQLEPLSAGFHLDIMDNHVVPNITWGPDAANAIDYHVAKPSWIHLMVEDPEKLIQRLALKHHSIVAWNVELPVNHAFIIDMVKQRQWSACLAINPSTSLEVIKPWLLSIDRLLIMAVHPGFSGQSFKQETYRTLEQARVLKDQHSHLVIALDGGLNEDNIARVSAYGVQEVAIGSAIFSQKSPLKALEALQALAKK